MLAPVLNTYKSAYSGLSRSTWLLSVVMLINRSGTMVVPFMTIYLIKMGHSVQMAGLVMAFFGFGAFCGAYFGGRLTDKIGFYPVQLITLAGGGLMFFVLAQMKTFWLICLFTYVLAFINEAFRPANSTAIAFYSTPGNRTRSYALNRLAINIGWAVGSSLGGVLAHIDYSLLFYVDGVTNILAAILIWIFLKPVDQKQDLPKDERSVMPSSPYKDKVYLLFILLTIFFAACFFQVFNNLSAFFYEELHFSEPLIGFLLAINGVIIALFEMVLVYRLDGKRKNISYISFGIGIVGISFLMFNLPGMGPALAFITISFLTFGEIFAMPFMNSFWISRTQQGNRGQYAALFTMAWSAAQTFGPLGGSQLAGHFGFKWLWFSAGMICILVAIGMKRLKENNF
jgi:predicted MFS family arabinose efflux permease